MDLLLLRVFQHQVLLQCQFFVLASDELRSISDGGLTAADSVTRVWCSFQNMLNAAANISKALWGSGGKLSAQRKPLRDSLGVDDTSILQDTLMRNNYEHYDSRVDKWWSDSKRHNHIDLGFGVEVGGVDAIDVFRNYDSNTQQLTFWGERFDLPALDAEVRRLLPRAREEAAKPHWETPG